MIKRAVVIRHRPSGIMMITDRPMGLPRSLLELWNRARAEVSALVHTTDIK